MSTAKRPPMRTREMKPSRTGRRLPVATPSLKPASTHNNRVESDVGGDAPGLVVGEQLGRRSTPRLLLEIDIGKRLPVGVADDEAGLLLVDQPGRRDAAR